MGKAHKHKYILIRRVVEKKATYEFYECINPLCPKRDRLVIKPTRKGNGK